MKTGDPVAEGRGGEDEALAWRGLSEAEDRAPNEHFLQGKKLLTLDCLLSWPWSSLLREQW